MHIKTKDKEINIPGWALLLGILVADNVATNVMKLISIKSSSKK